MFKLLGVKSKKEKEQEAAELKQQEAVQRQQIGAQKQQEAAQAWAGIINPESVATLTGHTSSVNALTALPNGQLASGSDDHTIKIWSPSSKKCVLTLSESTNSVYALTVLPNDQLASGSYGEIRLWDVTTGSCVSTFRGGHELPVYALTVLPDGRLASCSYDNTIKLWNVRTGSCESTLTGHPGSYVRALTVLPDGRLASGSQDPNIRTGLQAQMIKVWNLRSGRCEEMLTEHEQGVSALTVLPNGHLASGTGLGIKFWDVTRQQCVATLTGHNTGHAHKSYLTALTSLPNGQLASGSMDKTIKLWDVTRQQCVATLTGHKNVVTCLAALSNGQLASGSYDHSIKLWDLGFRPVLVAHKEIAIPRAPERPAKPKIDNAVREKAPVSHTPKTSGSDPFAEFEDFFSVPASSQATSKASTDWTSDFATMTPPLPPAKAIIPSLANMRISSNLTTIPWHALVIQRELGRGGFGVVCEALWQGTRVAIKQLIGQLTPALLSEFRSETEVHARLRHTNIIALYGVCIEPMKYALVMEFMASGSLFDVLKNPAELPWSLRLSLSLDMVSGLLYLHTQHIIHRDLKSLNILVDDHMRAKIADFGLAKIKLSTASMTKGGGGTPHWMAPELFDEVANSYASDVYATGVVLWEIAARKLPYEGKNASQLMRFVEKGNRETMPAGTPPPFGMLISRCWAQRAEERPSIEVVARGIREIQARLPNASSAKATVDSGYAAFSRS